MVLWKEIVAHPYFVGKSDEEKLRIARNYFSKNFDADPDFLKKSESDPEYRDRVWGNFVSKAIPKDKWATSISTPTFGGDIEGAAGPDVSGMEATPTPATKPSPGPTIDTTGILGTDVEGVPGKDVEAAKAEVTAPETDLSPVYDQPLVPGEVDVPKAAKMAGRGLLHGILGWGDWAGTMTEVAGFKIGSKTIEEAGKTAKDFWQKTAKQYEAPKELQGQIVRNPELLADASWWAYNVSEAVASFVPSIVAGGAGYRGVKIAGKAINLTPPVIARLAVLGGAITGGIVGGSQEGTQTYNEVLSRGGTKEQAVLAGEMMTAASAALNAISLGKIATGSPVGKKIRGILASAGTESLTEYLEEPAEIASKLAAGVKVTKKEIIEQLVSGVNVIPASAVLGGGAHAVFEGTPSVDIPKKIPKRLKKWWDALPQEDKEDWIKRLESGEFSRDAKESIDLNLLLNGMIQESGAKEEPEGAVDRGSVLTSPTPAGEPATTETPEFIERRSTPRPERTPIPEREIPDLETVRSEIARVEENLKYRQRDYEAADFAGKTDQASMLQATKESLRLLKNREEELLKATPPVESAPPPPPPPQAAPKPAEGKPSAQPIEETKALPVVERAAEGAPTVVRTERGTQVNVRYAIVEAPKLVTSHDTILRMNKDYPAELQPRDRTRQASELQVDRIARELAPEFLGESPKASDGAPIIGPDGVVESGNARTIAVKRVYESNSPNAAAYKDWLRDNAERFGLTREQIDAAKQPVLVRMRTDNIDRVRFAQEANEASVAAMSPSERAMTDAKNLPIDVLESLALGETGEITGASKILGAMVSPTEYGAYVMKDGTLNPDGLRRVRNAIFAKAFANPVALEKIAESPDPNVKNIATAMLSVAPRFAAIREAIRRGELYSLDIGPDIGDAMAKMSWLREAGKQTVEMYLSQLSADGRNLFGQQELSPVAVDILSAFDVHKRSSKIIAAILSRYADLAIAEGHPNQMSLLGPKTTPTVNEIWQRAKAAAEKDAGLSKSQGGLFAEREVPGGTRPPTTPETGKAPAEQRPRIGYDDALKPEQLAFIDDIPVSFLELPELLQLVQAINDGRLPRVATRLRKGILGYYSTKSKKIVISANLWQDDPITGMTGEERARKTVAHEIFHLIDDLPDDLIKQRGNILGRIATLKKYLLEMIDDMPRDVSEVVTAEERKAARKRIVKEARELSEDKDEQKKIAKELYAAWLAYEVTKRRVITKDEIIKELKAVSQAWKPFDETTDPRYTKYRYSSPELYADAGSVLINRPELLKSLAPKFYDAFFAYFERKPEVQEAYLDIQDIIRGGKVEESRTKTVRDMFDATERAWGAKRTKKNMNAKDFWELFKREMIDVNSYAIGKVKTAIKRGAKIDAESNPIYLYEEFIYGTAEEKAYLRGPNELFKDMEKAGISYEQMAEYIFHKRIALEGGRAQNSYQESLIGIQEAVGQEAYQRLIDEVSKYRGLPKRSRDLATLYETLGEAGVTTDQVDTFIRLTEGVTRGRAQMANPGGFTPRTSLEAVQALKKKMGKEIFNSMENAVGVYQTFMRQYVVERLRAAQMLTPELQAHIEANPEYVTFAVSSYIQQNYGPGIYAKIFRQAGTLQQIANPLTATLMKDLMLIKAINRKVALKSIVDFLKEFVPEDVKEAKREWTGRRMAVKEPYRVGLGPEWGTVMYPHNGKIEAYYVPKAVAKAFERNSRELNLVYEAGRLTNWFWREIFVGMNPGFMAFNAMRDLMRLSMNMPGGSLAKMFPYWWRALAPAKRRGFGLSDDTITAMEQGKMLITIEDRHGLSPEDTQMESLMKQYKMNPEEFERTVWGSFRKTADFLQCLGYTIEGMPKVAAYQYLKAQTKTVQKKVADQETGEDIVVGEEVVPAYSDKEIAHMVRVLAGSPDFLRKGAAYPFYNNIFLFSNAMKEGWRGDFEALRERPSEYAYKRLKYNIIPKILMYGLLAGLAGKKIKDAYEKVSAYDLTNYIVVVLGEMEDGRVVYLRIPQDETGRFLGGVFWKTIMGRKAADVASLADYMAGQAPNLTPSLSVPMDLISFYTGKNPYDSFRGRGAIPDRVFRAGGQSTVFSPDPAERWAAWQNDKAFAKYLIKEMGGQILYKFDHNDSKRAKTLLDKVLGIPVLGTNVLSRFIKISDQGTREMLRNVTGDIRTRKYQASLFIENKIMDHIENIQNPTPKDASLAYTNLLMDKTYMATLNTGKEGPDGKPVYREPIGEKEFTELYMKWAFRTGGTPYVQALIGAQSKEEKMAILNEFLKRQKGE